MYVYGMAHVCFYVCCSDCVGMFVVLRPLLKIYIFFFWSVEVCCMFV